MSFLRHWEIYQSDELFRGGSERQNRRPLLIVSMSFQLVIPGGLFSNRARFRFTNRGGLCRNPHDNTRLISSSMSMKNRHRWTKESR